MKITNNFGFDDLIESYFKMKPSVFEVRITIITNYTNYMKNLIDTMYTQIANKEFETALTSCEGVENELKEIKKLLTKQVQSEKDLLQLTKNKDEKDNDSNTSDSIS